MVRKVLATLAAAFAVAPAALAQPRPAELRALIAAHPGGTLTVYPEASGGSVTPSYVYGQAFCYSTVAQYVLGTAGGLAQEGLWVRPSWCAIPGLPPHIYSVDNSYRYEVCTGLILCDGTAGPWLASGGPGYYNAMYEWVGYYRWNASGINASAMLHLAWGLYEDGGSWSYGWT